MKRIRHAATGMLGGWLVLQAYFVILNLCAGAEVSMEGVRRYGAWSAVICVMAWLLIYLPVYAVLSRRRKFWNAAFVSLIGICGGGVGGVAIWIWLMEIRPWPFVLGALITGGTSALIGYVSEECEGHCSHG